MSTDSSQLISNNVAVTESVLYNVKPSSVRARQYRASLPSVNGVTFAPQSTAIFSIPARANCFLSGQESCLKFTIKYVNTANLLPFTDGAATSVISRIDVFSGSNLLETVQNANVLYSLMFDAVLDPAQRVGLSALYGMSNDITIPRKGQVLTNTSSAYAQLTVCVPLLTAVGGLNMDKYLPLSLSDDCRLEITFASNNEGMVKSGTNSDTFISGFSTDWVVQNPEYIASIVELDSEGMALVNSVAPPSGETVLHGTSFRSYNSSMPASSGGGYSTLIPARFASLNNILIAPRLSSSTVSAQTWSVSSRFNPNISSYYFRVGGQQIPAKPVILSNISTTGGYSEALFEMVKCFHTISTPMAATSLLSNYYNVAKTAAAQYGVIAVDASNSHICGFAIGQEFTTFSGRSDVLLCGANTLSSNIFFEAEISSSGNDAMVLNSFASFDILFVISDGLISARF
jgi:hypothetical protein